MKENLEMKGTQGYEHTSTKVASYVSECKGSATLAQCLDVLNSYRKKLLSECNNKEVVEARKALETARAKYNKLATKYVLSDSDYCNLQTEVVNAKKSLDAARANYNKLATKYVLSDSDYCNLQTEVVRSAVSEYSKRHKLPNFFVWFDNNGKDKQTSIIDSFQRLGSKLCALHQSFASGAKVAKKKSESISDLQKQIAELQAKLAAAQK